MKSPTSRALAHRSEQNRQRKRERRESREPLSSDFLDRFKRASARCACVEQCGAVRRLDRQTDRPSNITTAVVGVMSAANMMQSAQGAVSSGGNKMLKLIWGKANQPTAERLKIQKELFQFQKVRKKARIRKESARIGTKRWRGK